MRRAAAVLVAATLPLALGACSTPTGRRMYEGPALSPLTVTITTDPPGVSGGAAAPSTGVPRDAVFVVTLDDLPDPDTATFGPLLLRSGRSNFDAELHVDLVARTITIRPRTLLAPETTYEVQVDTRVGALSGRMVAATVTADFTAGTRLAMPPAPPEPPSWAGEIRPLLAGCQAGCHTAENPTRRLDLTGDPADPTFGLLSVPSLGLAGTPQALARVQPGDAAHSDLLRKLLGGDPHASSHDPPYPDTRVDGQRMPPGGPYLDDATLSRVAAWIDAGAKID